MVHHTEANISYARLGSTIERFRCQEGFATNLEYRPITTMVKQIFFVIAVASFLFACEAWLPHLNAVSRTPAIGRHYCKVKLAVSAPTKPEQDQVTKTQEPTPEETTKKYGLEVGIWQSLKQQDGGESAKSLLKRYGIAYLATSIPLAIISFAICYALVDNGVDVAGLLSNIGIENAGGSAGETAGTVAIAYAAHKAASPIRFPPTVILTPIVAKLIGKEPIEDVKE
jgi:Protein of unknown function (DUF1279)